MTDSINKALWVKIAQFDLDATPGEYTFSLRCADENSWTQNFTTQAINEYKKFMLLASTAGAMVSPSEIVDVVWHQHLIFTESYKEFCAILGQKIEHIPSTHHKADSAKFQQAKVHTEKLYKESFGEQPECIWKAQSMHHSLRLEASPYNLSLYILWGSLIFIGLFPIFYQTLKPIYITYPNPLFLLQYIPLILASFVILEVSNRHRLGKVCERFHPDSYIFNLNAAEIITLKTQKLSHVFHANVNELISKKIITVHADHRCSADLDDSSQASIHESRYDSPEQVQVLESLNNLGKCFYPRLVKTLATKKRFQNISKSMDGFLKKV
jgi:hypothetical protein